MKSIDIQTLNEMLGADDAPVLLDVRRRADFAANPQTIAGARWCDPENIDRWVKGLSSDRPIVLYCVKGGPVSQSAVDHLRKAGLDAAWVEGGLKAWIENGLPVQAVLPKPYTVQPDDIDLLHKAGVSQADIDHSVMVAEKALEIASRTHADLDMALVGRGALFHDLGKARTHEIEHGKLGAEMGLALGLPKAVTAVMEKHIRGGLSAEEAVELGLPVKDYTLGTLEERIIIYADRLVDIITDGIVEIQAEKEAEDRFEEILQSIPKYGKNDRTMARYLGYHREIQGLLND